MGIIAYPADFPVPIIFIVLGKTKGLASAAERHIYLGNFVTRV